MKVNADYLPEYRGDINDRTRIHKITRIDMVYENEIYTISCYGLLSVIGML